MPNIKTGKYSALTIIIASAFIAQSATAETQNTQDGQVRYAAIKLQSPSTAEAVIIRIHETANTICWNEMVPERHKEKSKLQRCLADVTQDLVDKIGNPNLDAAHGAMPAPKKLKHQKTIIPTSYVSLGSH